MEGNLRVGSSPTFGTSGRKDIIELRGMVKTEQVHIGQTNEEGAICTNKKGPVELWSTSSGHYTVHFHIDEDVFLYNKRDYAEEAQQLFNATVRMVKRR